MKLEDLQALIYGHVVQLTLVDVPIDEAFDIAHRVATLAFDSRYTEDSLAAARKSLEPEIVAARVIATEKRKGPAAPIAVR